MQGDQNNPVQPDFLALAEAILDAMDAAGDGSELGREALAIWALFRRGGAGGGRDFIQALRIARAVARLEAEGHAPWVAYELAGECFGLGRETVYRRLQDPQRSAERASVGFLSSFTEPDEGETDDTEVL